MALHNLTSEHSCPMTGAGLKVPVQTSETHGSIAYGHQALWCFFLLEYTIPRRQIHCWEHLLVGRRCGFFLFSTNHFLCRATTSSPSSCPG